MSVYSVSLPGPGPYGFRLQGGKDFNTPLTIARLNDGGKASQALIGIGDKVLSIDGIKADGITHLDAQNMIKACTGNLNMTLQKASDAASTAQKAEPPKEVYKPVPIAPPAATAVPKITSTSSVAYNKAPRPFGAVSSPKVTSIPSPSSAFTAATSASPRASPQPPSALSMLGAVTPPAPAGVHASDKPRTEGTSPALGVSKTAVSAPWQPAAYPPTKVQPSSSAQEAVKLQRQAVKESTVDKQPNGPPRKHHIDTYTDIYHIPSHTEDSKTRLMDNTEDWHPRTGTTQSRSFRILAQITGTENLAEAELENAKKTKLDSSSFSSPIAEPLIDSPPPHPPPLLPSQSDAASLSTSPHTSPRKRLFENPLETLPKGAPYPPPLIQVLKLDSHVAKVTKIATSLTRSRKPVRDPAFLTTGPDVPTMMTNGADNQAFAAHRCTVATQTSEAAATPFASAVSPCAVQPQTPTTPERSPSDWHFSVPPSAEKAGSVTETSGYQAKSAGSHFSYYSKSVLMANPLESLPKSAPTPAPLVPPPNLSPLDRASAVAAVSAAVGAQASDSLEPVNSGAYAAATSKSMPKGPENANKPAFAHTASTASTRPSAPTGTVKSTGWQPISQAAPATGRISNAPPHAGTAPNNKKPWTQPPPSEQDTLVQKAEHIPAGTRTPMCAHCNMVIRGPFLLALGKSWHPEEFNCAHCKKSMAESGFVQEKGSLYCDLCYGKFFAPECARCHRKILGEVINALKQTWHVTCFVCVACSQPIRSSTFHMEDGEPYCEADYYSLFGTMCHGCEFPIEAGDRFLEALGSTWHDTCFVCAVCCESLEGQTFFSKKDKPLCKKHAHSVNM